MSTQADNRTLLRLLGIRTPIIQAPMAGVSTPALAAAVSNAGGLGSLGVGATNAEGARKMIRETRALTDKPFNINVFCHQPAVSNAAVERAWLDWLAPVFEQYGATPPASLSEIYKSFVVDHEMQQMFVDLKPALLPLFERFEPLVLSARVKGYLGHPNQMTRLESVTKADAE